LSDRKNASTHKYPAIAAAVASLPARQAYLDGELCGVRSVGTTSFSLIQNASDTGNGDAQLRQVVYEGLRGRASLPSNGVISMG
jgi:ATP-dependent DNA ligase